MSHPDTILNVSSLDTFCEQITNENKAERFRAKILSISTDGDGNFTPEDVESKFNNREDVDLHLLVTAFVEKNAETARESARGILNPGDVELDLEFENVDPRAEALNPADDILDDERRAADSENRVTKVEDGALDLELSL